MIRNNIAKVRRLHIPPKPLDLNLPPRKDSTLGMRRSKIKKMSRRILVILFIRRRIETVTTLQELF